MNTDARNNSYSNITGIGKIPNYDNISSDYPSIKGSLYCMGPGQAGQPGDEKFHISWYNKKGKPNYISLSDDTVIQSFTGQHIVRIKNKEIHQNIEKYIGKIVSSTDIFDNYTTVDNSNDINNSLPIVELSNKEYSKNVFGVITNKINNKIEEYVKEDFYKKGYILVNSIGDGGLWILDNGLNIENGDYLVTSSLPGIAMKQNDDIKHNYTIAKITQDFNFEKDNYEEIEYNFKKYKIAFVGCIYCI